MDTERVPPPAREPEVSLVFTSDPWVEELHRYLTDHGGARVRHLVVEPALLLEERADVVVVSHRWPALTAGLVEDLHRHARAVVGVYDRDEPAGKTYLRELGVDAALGSDSAPATFVSAIAALIVPTPDPGAPPPRSEAAARAGELVVVGGPAGSGRTELAIALACALGAPLVDADDIAPSVAPRLGLPLEPNLRTAIDAVEHGRRDLATALHLMPGLPPVVAGLPNPRMWAQVRAGEVVRVVDRLRREHAVVVADGAGPLEEVGSAARGRFAVGRALVAEASALVVVCDAGPVGVARALGWVVDARAINAPVPTIVAINRAPRARFRRGELYEEFVRTIPVAEVVFVPSDRRVTSAAWDGRRVPPGPFTRAATRCAHAVRTNLGAPPSHGARAEPADHASAPERVAS